MVRIGEINNKEIWENFLLTCKEKTFLDSWNWGEFQKKEGNKIWRLGFYYSDNQVGAVLVVKIKAKRGTFLFVPHGPILIQNPKSKIQNNNLNIKTDILNALLYKLKKIAKGEKASFIRIAPIWQRNQENIRIFKSLGFRSAPIHIHPELTWELDISLPQEEILRNMRKTTRYLIRQAEKNPEIEIIKSERIEDLEEFFKLYKATAKRHKFAPFSFNYLKNQFDSFLSDRQIAIFLGKYKEEIICSAVIVFWQNIAFYHHGASSQKYNSNKAPASYLMQWQVIKEAQARNAKIYNFWGIAPLIYKKEKPESKKNHPWRGLSLFKMGFGGRHKEYVKTQDLILSPKYYLNFFVEKIRKIKRRL